MLLFEVFLDLASMQSNRFIASLKKRLVPGLIFTFTETKSGTEVENYAKSATSCTLLFMKQKREDLLFFTFGANSRNEHHEVD